jgi:ABC-2 type transporter
VLVTGRLLGGVLAAMAAIVPVLLLGAWSGVVSPPTGHWPALLALFVVTAVCASAVGAALGSVLRGAPVVSMAASVLATYFFFLGGGFTTTQFLPGWLRRISDFRAHPLRDRRPPPDPLQSRPHRRGRPQGAAGNRADGGHRRRAVRPGLLGTERAPDPPSTVNPDSVETRCDLR